MGDIDSVSKFADPGGRQHPIIKSPLSVLTQQICIEFHVPKEQHYGIVVDSMWVWIEMITIVAEDIECQKLFIFFTTFTEA